MGRLMLTLAVLVAATEQAQGTHPQGQYARAAWAWANVPIVDCNAAAAQAWTTALPCECGGTLPNCPCKNPKGLVWRPAPKGDVNNGKVLYLIEPSKCVEGKACTPEKIIGGVTIETGEYQPFDGKRWGRSEKPPIGLPHQEAAAIIAAALVGIVATDFDDCPGGVCFPQRAPAGLGSPFTTTAFSGGGAAVVQDGGSTVFAVAEARRFAPLRRMLSAPFRAIRAVRSRSTVVEVRPVEAVTVMQKVTEFRPVTVERPVTVLVPR